MKLMKKTFTVYQGPDGNLVKDTGGLNQLKLAVQRPTQRIQAKAQEAYNKRFAELLKSGTLVSAEIDKEMKRRNLWDDEQKQTFDMLSKKILEAEGILLKGGIKKSEAKKVAIQLIKDRAELIRLSSDRSRLQQESAEGQSENARFNYLIYACTVYDDGEKAGQKYFNSYDEFMESDDVVVGLAGAELMGLLFNVVEIQKDLPEYKFLRRYNMVDEELRFINKDGKPTDEDGRLIDSNGRFILEDGSFCDRDKKPVDKDGMPIVKFEEFLEDNENNEDSAALVLTN